MTGAQYVKMYVDDLFKDSTRYEKRQIRKWYYHGSKWARIAGAGQSFISFLNALAVVSHDIFHLSGSIYILYIIAHQDLRTVFVDSNYTSVNWFCNFLRNPNYYCQHDNRKSSTSLF